MEIDEVTVEGMIKAMGAFSDLVVEVKGLFIAEQRRANDLAEKHHEEWKELYAARTAEIERIAMRMGEFIEHQWHGGVNVLEVSPPPSEGVLEVSPPPAAV